MSYQSGWLTGQQSEIKRPRNVVNTSWTICPGTATLFSVGQAGRANHGIQRDIVSAAVAISELHVREAGSHGGLGGFRNDCSDLRLSEGR